MIRVLMAARPELYDVDIGKMLGDEFQVDACRDGAVALAMVERDRPDIMVLELRLAGMDGLQVLNHLRASGHTTKVFVLMDFNSDYVVQKLDELGVAYIFTIPCNSEFLVYHIRDLGFRMEHPGQWYLALEADRILYDLGFRVGRVSYFCTHEALCLRYRNYDGGITKEIYPTLARKLESNDKQVEKAIRDAIRKAWEKGRRSLWALYYPDWKERCPGNDEFLSRIAKALMDRESFRPSYVKYE